jgi:aspartate-semialdehyde dehydrogenase
MSEHPVVAVAGATGAVGRELVSVLDRVPWRPRELRALARLSSRETFLPWGEGRVGVDSLEEEDLQGVDLLFVALPAGAAAPVIRAALDADVRIVDLSGVGAAVFEAPLCVPWINPERWSPGLGIVAIPNAASTLVASVITPLKRAGLAERCHATVLTPASVKGRGGIDELSQQVVALLNSQTPKRQLFPDGLAFDLEPFTGVLQEDGRSDGEQEVVAHVQALVGEGCDLEVAIVGVPLFSGIAMQLTVHSSRPAAVELVRQILSDGGVKMDQDGQVRSNPRPRLVEGQPFAHAGRVRVSAEGRVLQVFAAMDNLHTAAMAAASCGRLMWGENG